MTDYDIFAPFYDAVMGDRGDVVRLIRKQIKKHMPSAHSILELGCGTGSILEGLAGKFEVAGIERSAEMLRQAQAKLPTATLVHGTIAGFQLYSKYDVAICVFDTINHLTHFMQWRRLFRSTLDHLNPGGLLIFDMNTLGRLSTVAASPGYSQTFNRRSTFHLHANLIEPNTIEWQVAVEIPAPDGAIQVYEEYIREASYPLQQVSQAVTEYGFTVVDCFASGTLLPSETSDRVYFVCKAPER